MKPIYAIFTAMAAVLGGWGVYENTAMLCTRRYEVQTRIPRLVMVSDLHRRRFGKKQEKLIRKVADQHPDIIILTGDLISRKVRDFSETEYLLKRLHAIAPVLSVPGNHELDFPVAVYQAYQAMLQRCGVLSLENRIVTVAGIPFAGLTLNPSYYRGGKRLGFAAAHRCTAADVQAALGDCPSGTVLLAHNPLYFPAYAEWGAALTLSGHVHGGAVRLPLLGGVLSPERNFFPKYDKGLFRIGASELLVSGGLGKLRLWNPPEICVVESAPANKTHHAKQ